MCIREYKGDWQQMEKELHKQDVLQLSSLLDLGDEEEEVKKRLNYCKQKDISLCVGDSYLKAEVYMGILQLMKAIDDKKKLEIQQAQRIGIQRALEKKKAGQGGYGRPRVKLPNNFVECVKECIRSDRPLEEYRRKTGLKTSTFYKYAHLVKLSLWEE